ncbi:MAG: RluA family pseudouridine synthase [Spirochaetaceae bacterium]|nr:RluA family pseudouridine synthase [Spirochaetaceae bacterium]
MGTVRLRAGPDDEGRRLDRVLRKACAELPISAIHRLLRKGLVSVDGKRAGQACLVKSGQSIEIPDLDIAEAAVRGKNCRQERRQAGSVISIGNGIEVLYEGQGILAICKPAGIATQEELGALVLGYLEGKIEPSLSFTPGPLHRLDRSTSGVIVFGKSLSGARLFSELLRSGLLRKVYIALLEGGLHDEQLWRDRIGYSNSAQKAYVTAPRGGPREGPAASCAETLVFPLELQGNFTLAAIEIATGRRHQIRAQAAARGFPLYGDRKYGGRERPPFFLHACRLVFPETSPFPRSISAPPPPAFQQKLLQLGFSPAVLSAGVLPGI